jgi:hypothetical protein
MQKVKPSNLLKPLVEELNGELFRAWRQAMQAAQSRIEQEKARALRQLTPEQSLRLYHALWERSRHLFDYTKPSPLVQRVQAVFRRYLEAQQGEPSRSG